MVGHGTAILEALDRVFAQRELQPAASDCSRGIDSFRRLRSSSMVRASAWQASIARSRTVHVRTAAGRGERPDTCGDDQLEALMITVGTWNLENLYRPGGQFGPKTQAAYDAKLDTLAATITAIAPDVLAVRRSASRRP
jgi:hypothetical protein